MPEPGGNGGTPPMDQKPKQRPGPQEREGKPASKAEAPAGQAAAQPPDQPKPPDTVTLTIDGQSVTVPKGTLIVEAAKELGIEIPVFCYHHKLTPVGACRLCQFYAYESCGKCTPCRVGGNWAVRTLHRILSGEGSAVDLQILDRIQESIQYGRCLCPLGDSVGAVILSCMTHFREEFEEHALRNECTPKGRVREKEAVGA